MKYYFYKGMYYTNDKQEAYGRASGMISEKNAHEAFKAALEAVQRSTFTFVFEQFSLVEEDK